MCSRGSALRGLALSAFVLPYHTGTAKDCVLLRATAGNRSGSTQPLSAYSAFRVPRHDGHGVAACAPCPLGRLGTIVCAPAVILEPQFRRQDSQISRATTG